MPADPTPRATVIGDACLGAALAAGGVAAAADVVAGGVVVVAGDVAGRAEAARAAVAAGAHVFVAWPPGATAEAEALLRDAEEAGVEVGVERPLAWPAAAAPSQVVAVTLATDGTAWPRRIAGALDVCAGLAGRREAVRVTAEADRDGARLRAVAVTVRFQNGVLAHVLVRSGEASGAVARVTSGGAEASGDVADALAAEAAAFVRAVAAGRPAAYPLHDALATLRLAERVAAALR